MRLSIRTLKNVFAVAIGLLVLLIGFALVRYALKKRLPPIPPIISIATSADYPPFSFVRDGELVGFDIDLAKEIAKRLGKEYILHDVPFDLIFLKLSEGEHHIAIAGITPTPQRERFALFSTPYLGHDPLVILSPARGIKPSSMLDLEGKRLAVVPGYAIEEYLKRFPKIISVAQPSIEDGVLAIKSDLCDALVTASGTLNHLFEKYGQTNFNVLVLPDVDEHYAIAIDKAYPFLRDAINTALKAITDDGTLQQLRNKWEHPYVTSDTQKEIPVPSVPQPPLPNERT